jgi:Uma2 family endonuclease
VTSDSSEEYDTGEKFGHYQTIPSLRAYIVVSHRERRITVHARSGAGINGGDWITRTALAGGTVAVDCVDATLTVDQIYRASSVK